MIFRSLVLVLVLTAAGLAAAQTPPASARKVLLQGPVDLPTLVRAGRGAFSTSAAASTAPEALFDGNRFTGLQLGAAGAAEGFVQAVLDRPRPLTAAEVTFPAGGTFRWSLSAANTLAEMRAHSGAYRLLVAPRETQDDRMDQATLTKAAAYRVYRLTFQRLTGEGALGVNEWALWTPQALSRLEVEAFTTTVGAGGGLLQLRARAHYEAGARENVTNDVRWEVLPPQRGRVDELTRLTGNEPGPATVTAIHEGVRSAPLAVTVLPSEQSKPDWVVTHIERMPRVPLDDPRSALQPGQSVYWLAHVKNYGVRQAEPVTVEWRWDGKPLGKGKLPPIARFGQTEVMIRSKWDGAPHRFEFAVDPGNAVPEVSEENNRLEIDTEATPVGFWVEDGTLQYFHAHQHRLGIGSNSWEDWAQRQVRFWNGGEGRRVDAGCSNLETPPQPLPGTERGSRYTSKPADPGPPVWIESESPLLRAGEGGWGDEVSPPRPPTVASSGRTYRLDRIIVVGDGMLPLAGGSPTREPDRREKTVRLMFGFPAYHPGRDARYRQLELKREDNPFYLDSTLRAAVNGG